MTGFFASRHAGSGDDTSRWASRSPAGDEYGPGSSPGMLSPSLGPSSLPPATGEGIAPSSSTVPVPPSPTSPTSVSSSEYTNASHGSHTLSTMSRSSIVGDASRSKQSLGRRKSTRIGKSFEALLASDETYVLKESPDIARDEADRERERMWSARVAAGGSSSAGGSGGNGARLSLLRSVASKSPGDQGGTGTGGRVVLDRSRSRLTGSIDDGSEEDEEDTFEDVYDASEGTVSDDDVAGVRRKPSTRVLPPTPSGSGTSSWDSGSVGLLSFSGGAGISSPSPPQRRRPNSRSRPAGPFSSTTASASTPPARAPTPNSPISLVSAASTSSAPSFGTPQSGPSRAGSSSSVLGHDTFHTAATFYDAVESSIGSSPAGAAVTGSGVQGTMSGSGGGGASGGGKRRSFINTNGSSSGGVDNASASSDLRSLARAARSRMSGIASGGSSSAFKYMDGKDRSRNDAESTDAQIDFHRDRDRTPTASASGSGDWRGRTGRPFSRGSDGVDGGVGWAEDDKEGTHRRLLVRHSREGASEGGGTPVLQPRPATSSSTSSVATAQQGQQSAPVYKNQLVLDVLRASPSSSSGGFTSDPALGMSRADASTEIGWTSSASAASAGGMLSSMSGNTPELQGQGQGKGTQSVGAGAGWTGTASMSSTSISSSASGGAAPPEPPPPSEKPGRPISTGTTGTIATFSSALSSANAGSGAGGGSSPSFVSTALFPSHQRPQSAGNGGGGDVGKRASAAISDASHVLTLYRTASSTNDTARAKEGSDGTAEANVVFAAASEGYEKGFFDGVRKSANDKTSATTFVNKDPYEQPQPSPSPTASTHTAVSTRTTTSGGGGGGYKSIRDRMKKTSGFFRKKKDGLVALSSSSTNTGGGKDKDKEKDKDKGHSSVAIGKGHPSSRPRGASVGSRTSDVGGMGGGRRQRSASTKSQPSPDAGAIAGGVGVAGGDTGDVALGGPLTPIYSMHRHVVLENQPPVPAMPSQFAAASNRPGGVAGKASDPSSEASIPGRRADEERPSLVSSQSPTSSPSTASSPHVGGSNPILRPTKSFADSRGGTIPAPLHRPGQSPSLSTPPPRQVGEHTRLSPIAPSPIAGTDSSSPSQSSPATAGGSSPSQGQPSRPPPVRPHDAHNQSERRRRMGSTGTVGKSSDDDSIRRALADWEMDLDGALRRQEGSTLGGFLDNFGAQPEHAPPAATPLVSRDKGKGSNRNASASSAIKVRRGGGSRDGRKPSAVSTSPSAASTSPVSERAPQVSIPTTASTGFGLGIRSSLWDEEKSAASAAGGQMQMTVTTPEGQKRPDNAADDVAADRRRGKPQRPPPASSVPTNMPASSKPQHPLASPVHPPVVPPPRISSSPVVSTFPRSPAGDVSRPGSSGSSSLAHQSRSSSGPIVDASSPLKERASPRSPSAATKTAIGKEQEGRDAQEVFLDAGVAAATTAEGGLQPASANTMTSFRTARQYSGSRSGFSTPLRGVSPAPSPRPANAELSSGNAEREMDQASSEDSYIVPPEQSIRLVPNSESLVDMSSSLVSVGNGGRVSPSPGGGGSGGVSRSSSRAGSTAGIATKSPMPSSSPSGEPQRQSHHARDASTLGPLPFIPTSRTTAATAAANAASREASPGAASSSPSFVRTPLVERRSSRTSMNSFGGSSSVGGAGGGSLPPPVSSQVSLRKAQSNSEVGSLVGSSVGGTGGDSSAGLDEETEEKAKELAKKAWDEEEAFLKKEKIAEWLGGVGRLNRAARRHYFTFFDFSGMRVDEAFRKMCAKLYLKAETQQVDRILDAFSRRYWNCNRGSVYGSSDVVHAIIFSVLLLNTDLHIADIEKRMTRGQFVRNTMSAIHEQRNLPPEEESSVDLTGDDAASTYSGFEYGQDRHGHSGARVRTHRSGSLQSSTSLVRESQPGSTSNLHAASAEDVNQSSPGRLGGKGGLGHAGKAGSISNVSLKSSDKQWDNEIESLLKDIFNAVKSSQIQLPMLGDNTTGAGPQSRHQGSLSPGFSPNRTRGPRSTMTASSDRVAALKRGSIRGIQTLLGGSNPSTSSSLTSDGRVSPTPSTSTSWTQAESFLQTPQTSISGMSPTQSGTIGFASNLSQTIIKEQDDETRSMSSDDSGTDDERLALYGPPWAKEGVLTRKHYWEVPNKRARDKAWVELFVVVSKGKMSMFRFGDAGHADSRSGGSGVGGGNWLSTAKSMGEFELAHSLSNALPPPGYNRQRPHVFALTLASGAVYFFQTGTEDLVNEWVQTCNYWAARQSREPLPGGVSNMEYGWNKVLPRDGSDSLADVDETPRASDTFSMRSGKSSKGGSRGGLGVPPPGPQKWSDTASMMTSGSVSLGSSNANDRLFINEWKAPQPPTVASTLGEEGQLARCVKHVARLEADLAEHNELRMPIMQLYSPRSSNAAKSLANWERKSQHLLSEMIKFQSYADALRSAIRLRAAKRDEREVNESLRRADEEMSRMREAEEGGPVVGVLGAFKPQESAKS